MSPSPKSLPIYEIELDIIHALEKQGKLVLVAPTGSGKTTQVPQMALDAGLAGAKKIVVLQPRRVAARTVAARVAWERGCKLGSEVGYQVRFDDCTSLGTRISYVTEGILLRWLQDDTTLKEVGLVVFDEFHERNLFSDVALGLVKRLRRTARPDLKLAVMSATLEAEPVADYLSVDAEGARGPATPILHSEGISFPVEVNYLDLPDDRPESEQAADAAERIIVSAQPGDILIFMPGMGEINATIGALRAMRAGEKTALIPLHGDLPPEDQDLAFAPNPLRKIIVATNVAETSVTIDGIRHVIDSGLARIARFDAERGIRTLFVEKISRASAEQRKGRAGRTAPGTCHRLWTQNSQLDRPERNTPEIQRSDLAEVVLLLHSLGIKRAAQFDWLDRPDPAAIQRAEQLLLTLGALKIPAGDKSRESEDGGARTTSEADLTPVGRKMLRLPMDVRYSRMLVEAQRLNCVPAAALCAALVSGRDLMMRVGRDDKHIKEARELFEASQDSDFHTLMRAYQYAKNSGFSVEACRRYGIHALTARQVEQTYEQILNLNRQAVEGAARAESAAGGPERASDNSDPLLRCIMTGFIDQLCIRRDLGTLECDLTEGRHGTLMRESVVQNASLFVAGSIREVTGRGSQNLTLLGLASAVKREWIEEVFPEQMSATIEHLFDRTHKRVAAVRLVRFRDLVIHHEHQRELDPKESGRCLAEAHLQGIFELPLFNHEIKQLIGRLNVVNAAMPKLEFPRMDRAGIKSCLSLAFEGLNLAKQAQATPLKESFVARLGPERAAWLDEIAPQSITWHDGRRLKMLYPEPGHERDDEQPIPELQIKIQECFGLKDHPAICEGRIPVKLWLCAPDGKRLEATLNWIAFKSTGYPKLKPSLQKKYPSQVWP